MMWANPKVTYWTSAANRRLGVCNFAIAASYGSVLLRKNGGPWILERSPSIYGLREAVAVDWLSSDVVFKGHRDGAVRLWDTRCRPESREPRIQHSITINHVRSINENLVVVAGLQNEVMNGPFAQSMAGLII